MKKLLIALLALVFVFSLASCDMLPEELQGVLDGFLGGGEHVHEFVLDEEASEPATCKTEGLEVRVCSCGEKQETELPILEHDMKLHEEKIPPNCDQYGSRTYKCTLCGKTKSETIKPIGHVWGEVVENSRLVRCTRETCTSGKLVESNGKHTESLTFNFTADHEAAIDAKYDEVLAMLNAAAKYDPALHGYAEEGELAEAYAVVDKAHTELYDLILHAISQRQLAEIAYYCDMKDADLEKNYTYMMDYYTAVIAKFYTLSQPFYDSCYREFYYYGMTEEEITAFLFDSDALSNPEYAALKERNNAIEAEVIALSESERLNGDKVPTLYAEFVENNNKMANLMGYDNYLEYAYGNVYGRDYTYQDVSQVTGFVKRYFAGLFNSTYEKWNNLTGGNLSEATINEYYSQVSDSFFVSVKGNTTLNDYIDLLAFNSNPDKQISFSDELNKLMVDGNLFRGDYDGAFVTTITGVDIPVAYFGPGYDNAFTVAHEFGHYMNEVYSGGEADQSYDLLEMHSQGNELLYLFYVETYLSEAAYELVETMQLLNMLNAIMAGLAVDSFEQAIYLNSYSGAYSDTIMLDGKITADEYDLLYRGIIQDFGTGAYQGTDYWRYGMTITSPCYYVSYSISAISVLQLYEMAHTQGFDVAKDAYLKIFSYVDEDPDMSMEEVFEYAGLRSYTDEQLYKSFSLFYANDN